MKKTAEGMAELAAALKEARASGPRKPRKPHGSIRKAVAASADDLLAMRDDGFSDAEIAEIFKAKGFAAKAGTLKTYINVLRAKRNDSQRSEQNAAKPLATKTAAIGRQVKKAARTAASVPAQATGKPSDQARRPPAADGPTTASKALGHRINDDV